MIVRKSEDAKKVNHPCRPVISIREYLKNRCDLQGELTKKVLKGLANYCSVDAKEDLLSYTRPEGKAKFKSEIKEKQLTILQIIENYNINLPFEAFVNICPEIKPREYTIASSNAANPKNIHMIIALTVDFLGDEDIKLGLTSQYIQNLFDTWQEQETFINCFTSDSSFTPPNDNQDVTMIATGSGMAPFRAMLQEKAFRLN